MRSLRRLAMFRPAQEAKLHEPDIVVRSREELIYLLTEAAEIEHGLMCCYLFAVFGLKTEADGLSAEAAAEVASWGRAVTAVAVEEMTHLALVNNLLAAIGAAPHFGRPNFPVAAGYHPAGVVAELRRFDRATLDHFVFLERPEGVDLPDGAGFAADDPAYRREAASRRLMPSAQDYLTVGHLYRGIRAGFVGLAGSLGEAALFAGDPARQVGPPLAALPGLAAVTDLASALAALDTIVEQGEGSQAAAERSHYRRFLAVRAGYDARLARDPAFDPSRPVAPNPVMRRPPHPEGRTYIDHPRAARVIDLANAIYGAMLRALAQGFVETDPVAKKRCLDAGIDAMFALRPVAEHLTRLPACAHETGLAAGMSFAVLRDLAPFPPGAGAVALLAETFGGLAAGVAQAVEETPVAEEAQRTLAAIADRLSGKTVAAADPVETAEGRDLVISFDTKRCIHARFCVLGEPSVFKANVAGPWIAPDEATSTENLVAVARNCPSGAITYVRRDGGPEEPPPPVNLVQVRENGPLALRAALILDGAPAGFRATLCRCGQSQNKPFCDGSHVKAGFVASGEPATGDTTALAVRDGPLDVRPQTNGPLAVSGNMEMISGTGRTFRKAVSAMLCRCGGSASKPFCDGTHARIGFRG